MANTLAAYERMRRQHPKAQETGAYFTGKFGADTLMFLGPRRDVALVVRRVKPGCGRLVGRQGGRGTPMPGDPTCALEDGTKA